MDPYVSQPILPDSDGSPRIPTNPDGSQRILMDPNESERIRTDPDGTRWVRMDSVVKCRLQWVLIDPIWEWWIPTDFDGYRYIPMDPDGSRWFQWVPDGFRWIPIVPNWSHWIPMADLEILVNPSILDARNYSAWEKVFGLISCIKAWIWNINSFTRAENFLSNLWDASSFSYCQNLGNRFFTPNKSTVRKVSLKLWLGVLAYFFLSIKYIFLPLSRFPSKWKLSLKFL